MDNLRIYLVTYNVATRYSSENLLELLGLDRPDAKSNLPDFYVVGLQEVKAQPQNYVVDAVFDDPWTNLFKKYLMAFGYVKVKTIRLVGLVLSVYCLRRHIVHLRDIQTQYTRTGLLGLWGNKGGVTLRLQIYGCSLCFVNCHLSAHDHLLRERIREYNSILESQHFPLRETTTIMFHDYVFWLGDMNFRLNGLESPVEILKLIEKGDYSSLLEKDQLREIMLSGEAFSELFEPDVSFPPTYKYLFNSSEYDLKRRSAWTDRILYKANTNAYENVALDAHVNTYKSLLSYSASDHKPVIADFVVKVFSHYDERMVRVTTSPVWYINEVNSGLCSFGSDVIPNTWDWVGLFEDRFSSLSDYLCYMYVGTNSKEPPSTLEGTPKPELLMSSDKIELIFHEGMVRSPGKYRLIYFTHDSSSILGMSSVFEAVYRSGDNNATYVDSLW